MAQAALVVPLAFRNSYDNSQSYPCNLMNYLVHTDVLQAYRTRLSDLDPKLFSQNFNEHCISTLECVQANQAFVSREVRNEAELKDWIGDRPVNNQQGQPSVGLVATRPDPICRFIFLSAVHGRSRNPLRLTRHMLTRILSYHQVTPEFLDFISVFGDQDVPRGLRFSAFKKQCMLSNPSPLTAIRDLGRTGRQYEICYNLRAVARKNGTGIDVQSTRMDPQQAAFYHQFDVDSGRAVWIVAKGDLKIESRLKTPVLPPQSGNLVQSFIASLEVHRRHCHWATEGWTWYLQWLEAKMDMEIKVPLESPDGSRVTDVDTIMLQNAQYFETKANEVVMILRLNADIITCMKKFYDSLLDHAHLLLDPINSPGSRDAVETFSNDIQVMNDDFGRAQSRAEILLKESVELKTLIVQRLQSQAAQKMESLANETYTLGRLTLKDSTSMRIITVVTLIYLPATFVSTFFSTDVIKYQNPNSDENKSKQGTNKEFKGSYSALALERWCEVTFSLTFLTLALGWAWYRWELHKRRQ